MSNVPMLALAAVVVSLTAADATAACGPGYRWTYATGATGDDVAHAVAVDDAGNIYLTGQFAGTVNFNPPGSDSRTSNGGADVFVTKLAADGSYAWTRTFGGSNDDLAEGLAVDGSGNVYVSGLFRGLNVDFDPTGGEDRRSSKGGADAFVVRLGADGSYGWCATIGGSDFDLASALAVGSDGYVVIVGYFGGSNVDFDPTGGTDARSSAGSSDVFVTRLGLDRTYGWTRTMGGGGQEVGVNVAVGTGDQIAVTGWFTSPLVDFDPTAGEDWHANSGESDVFLTKLADDGSYGWTRTFGGASYDLGYAVVVNGLGDVYVAGIFQGSDVDFDPGSAEDLHSSAGSYDVFVSKFQADGQYRFCRTFGGPLYDVARALAVDSYGGLLVAGAFEGVDVDFDYDGGIDLHSSNGFSDVFLTRVSLDGSYRWTRTVGGAEADCAYGVDLLPSGDIALAGYFRNSDVDFDPTAGIDGRSSQGEADIFATVWLGPVPGDLDCDGDVDLNDFALFAEAMNGPNRAPGNAEADLDGDGDCDLLDFAAFTAKFSALSSMPGDLDRDGDVDLADFVGFAEAFSGSGSPSGRPEADLDGDGDCDLADFALFWSVFSGPL